MPTLAVLAFYYAICDCVLLGQVFYYRCVRSCMSDRG